MQGASGPVQTCEASLVLARIWHARVRAEGAIGTQPGRLLIAVIYKDSQYVIGLSLEVVTSGPAAR